VYDLIIVGAGPAGSSAARTAAKLGLKTLLLEKEKMPRNKLCGGGVTPKVLKLLDFKLPDDLIECAPRSTRIHVGGNCFEFQTPAPLVYMTSRLKFDKFLADKAVEAGAELRQETPALRVEPHESGCEVVTRDGSFTSRIVIGADGMSSPTARSAGFYSAWSSEQVAYAIESEIPVGEKGVEDFIGEEEYFDIFFGVSAAGYGWVFPKDDHLTVGVGCRLSKLRDAQTLFKDFVRGIPELEGCDIPKPQAHLVPLGGAAKVHTSSNRVLLAGDSAGFAEPLLGEGICFAVWGAQVAAQVAAQACKAERFDANFLKSYEKRWRKAFGIDFDVAYRVACFSYLEQYDMDRVARFFFSNRRMQECMVGLMEGSMRYRDVRAKIAWPYLKYSLAKLGLPINS
jgi:geranylgeranyl reductase family protein